MFRKIYILIVLFVSFNINSQTTTEWREDLDFLSAQVNENYNFLFKKVSQEKFNEEVTRLNKAIPNLEDHEIKVGLAKLVSMLQYGHTAIDIRPEHTGFRWLPMNVYEFNDGVYVQGATRENSDVLGAKILRIEKTPIEEAMDKIYPVVPAENEQFFKAYGIVYLMIPEVLHAQGVIDQLSDSVEFTFEKNGKEFQKTIKATDDHETMEQKYGYVFEHGDWLEARNKDKTPLYLKDIDRLYFYEYLEDQQTVYIRHSSIRDEEDLNIADFYDRVFDFIDRNKVEKLIIDVRLNGGGNNYKNKPIITNIIECEKINKTGKLFVIIGKRTFSACQNLVNELDNYTNAIFVGEPTAENINFYGDNNRLELPNSKLPVYLSFAWWQDKPQWENAEWLAPHLAVDMSFEQYKNNEDPVLQAALDFSDKDIILDPMTYLTELFMEGEMEKLRSEAVKMLNDPRYSFFEFENEFNSAGYKLLGNDQIKEAIFVFELNAELFPESANTWDSLAEAHLKSGNKEKAIELYNKAISLDPEGNIGAHAKSMLKEIESGN